MRFPSPLVQGTLIKRYKRFLADVRMDNGEIITAHCPNTGTMLSCSAPDSRVCLSRSDNPKRKYPFTLEMVKDNVTWVGVNTARTNTLVAESLEKGQIAEFDDIKTVKTEIKTSDHTRLDLQVIHGEDSTFIEVKNCSLAMHRWAMFPDAVTARGTKHLHELMRLSQQGQKTCIFFLVQRTDADRFCPAAHIDGVYSKTLQQAAAAGVMVLVYQAEVSPKKIEVVRSLPCYLFSTPFSISR
jgi:sugar fermentation stimulation protein A